MALISVILAAMRCNALSAFTLFLLALLNTSISAYEIKTTPVPLTPFGGIVTHVGQGTLASTTSLSLGGPVINSNITSPLRLYLDLDLANETACRSEVINFNTRQDATISLQLEPLDVNGEPNAELIELFTNEFREKGQHDVRLSLDSLGSGRFKVHFHSVGIDGTTEDVEGTLNVAVSLSDTLPVGHPIVKGVDLFNGGMVISRSDIDLAGRGAGLSFTRTYASSSNQIGVLGHDWTHNYLSRVVQSSCGGIRVIGGEGSGMEFRVDAEGNYQPSRGYHGSLDFNPSDNSYDFNTPSLLLSTS